MPAGAQNVSITVRKGRSTTTGTRASPNGAFTLWKLDPGKYTLTAMWYGPGTRMQSSPAEIEVSDANIDHVTLNFLTPMEFSVRVVYDDDGARPRQPQSAQGQKAPPQVFRIQFNPLDVSATSQTVDLGPDDSFHLTGLTPNRYRVAPTWRPAFVKSMQLGPLRW